MTPSFLIIFDFDWSFINENSDTWVVELLPEAVQYMNNLRLNEKSQYGPNNWTKLMDHMVGYMMKEKDVSLDDIINRLKCIPYFNDTFDAAKLAHENNAELIILSDANTFYIDQILLHHNLKHLFTQVITNPSSLDDNRILRVNPYESKETPHNCKLCPPNLCKGKVLQQLRNTYVNGIGDSIPVIYIGNNLYFLIQYLI
jgi:pyridoxal phosphate phosphatase PHOSPHO2